MALFREIDKPANTVQFKYAGEPITPKMNLDDPKELLKGLGDALELAYQKIRDASGGSAL